MRLTGKPPLILIFDIRCVGPLVDLNTNSIDSVAALDQEVSDIKFGCIPAALTVSNFLAVHKDVKCAIDALKA